MLQILPASPINKWLALRSVLFAGDTSELVGTLVFQGVVILLGVVLDELLHRADAMRPVPNDGEGDDVPAENLAQQIGRVLPFIERAAGKIPKRGFAFFRFIDGQAFVAVQLYRDNEGVVRTQGGQLIGDNLSVTNDVGGSRPGT